MKKMLADTPTHYEQNQECAHREATDYKHVIRKVSPTEKLNIHLAPAGGWTARFTL